MIGQRSGFTSLHPIAIRIGGIVIALVIMAPRCERPPFIKIDSHSQGDFVTGATTTVQGNFGRVEVDASTEVTVNGVTAVVQSDSTFSAVVPLDYATVFNRIVAEVSHAGIPQATRQLTVVAVDGVNSTAVPDGDTSPDSLALRVGNLGLDQIEPVMEDLAASSLDITSAVMEQNPILQDECVVYNLAGVCTHWGTANALEIGYESFTLDAASSGPHRIDIGFTVNDLFAEVDLDVRDGSGGRLLCGLEIYATSVDINSSVDLLPNANDPRYVNVNQTSEPTVVLNGFGARFISGICDDPFFGNIINFFVQPQLRGVITNAFIDNLKDPDVAGPQDSIIADALETALSGVAIAGPIGESIGAILTAPFSSIDEDPSGLTMLTDSAVTQPVPAEGAPELAASYALLEEGVPAFGALTPGGLPYGMGFGVSTTALNQMLKAFVEGGMLPITINEFDQDGVVVPLDVATMSTIIPEFAAQGAPQDPVVVHVAPTIAPVFTGQPGPNGEMAALSFGGVLISFEVVRASSSKWALRADVMFTVGVDFVFTPEGVSLVLGSLDESSVDTLITLNRVFADDASLAEAIDGLVPSFGAPLASAIESMPIPALLGLDLAPVEVGLEGTWLALYADLHEKPRTTIQHVTKTWLGAPNNRLDGFFDVFEFRRRLSMQYTDTSIDAALRGFVGADACCWGADVNVTTAPHYQIRFDIVSAPDEEWELELEHSLQGQFDLVEDSANSAFDGGGMTAFQNGGVIAATYSTSTGESGSFDFIAVPPRVDHAHHGSFFSTHQPFSGSNRSVLSGTGDMTVTLDLSFSVSAVSDSNAVLPLADGDKVGIRFGKADTIDNHFGIGAYPGYGDRDFLEDGHKTYVRLTSAPAPFCGDGDVDPGEECDDGNNDDGDGCASDCTAEIGTPVCGNDILEGAEFCEASDGVDCTTLGTFIGGTAHCNVTCNGWDVGTCTSPPASTCTVEYDLNSTFQITNTFIGAGDQTNPNQQGLLVLEYRDDGNGNIIDGEVNMLHYWILNDFTVGGLVTVTTKVHSFSPNCNGEVTPDWRSDTDPGFPARCEYEGNTAAVASGVLHRNDGTITWDDCNVTSDYWAGGNRAYKASDVSEGPGCIAGVHSVGNVNCAGAVCSAGNLAEGNNPQFDSWTQPMINGFPGVGANGLTASSDPQLTFLDTPTGATGGFQSWNVPNNSDSRTWSSWTATRNSASPNTTCN
jgi:cysteine-rich repeat protein